VRRKNGLKQRENNRLGWSKQENEILTAFCAIAVE
jgi:hypothetical protein